MKQMNKQKFTSNNKQNTETDQQQTAFNSKEVCMK